MSFYFIYKISQGSSQIIKNLEKIERVDSYKAAKKIVSTLRQEQSSNDSAVYKIVFAESELEAEEMLMEKREAPIIQEWEK